MKFIERLTAEAKLAIPVERVYDDGFDAGNERQLVPAASWN